MKKIKIIKNVPELNKKIKDKELSVIYCFLMHDYLDLPTFLSWLNNKNEDWFGTNLCFIEKENENIILGFTGDYEHEDVFKTKPEHFADMLKQRDLLWKKKPQEFVIKLSDDGRVTLEYDQKEKNG